MTMSKLAQHERSQKKDWSKRSMSCVGRMSWGNWFIRRRMERQIANRKVPA